MTVPPIENQLSNKVKIWFEGFMHGIQADYLMMEQNVANPRQAMLYKLLANGDANDINFMSRQQSSVHFLQRLVLAYLDELKNRQAFPPKLAMDYKSLSLTKLNKTDYLAYSKLQGLARRARYLCHEGPR